MRLLKDIAETFIECVGIGLMAVFGTLTVIAISVFVIYYGYKLIEWIT